MSELLQGVTPWIMAVFVALLCMSFIDHYYKEYPDSSFMSQVCNGSERKE